MVANNNPVINRIVILALLSYPILLLTIQGGMNAVFFLLVLTSLLFLLRAPRSTIFPLWDGYSSAFAIAMASPILAVLLSEAYHGTISAPPLDGPSRFLFAIPIFLALRKTPISSLTILQYGFPLGALSALLITMLGVHKWDDIYYFVNHIRYSDMALIFGLLSLYCINWVSPDRTPVLTLKICGLLAGLYLSIQSGTRGGWIAIPLLIFIWWFSLKPKISWPILVAGTLSALMVVLLSYELIGSVHSRLEMISQNLSDFNLGHEDTSIGVRLQLWHAAYYLFREYPVFGVGPGGFAQMMGPLTDSGMLTPMAADFGRGEVHNEILAKTAEMGLFGFLSVMSIFAVPLIIFIRSLRTTVAVSRAAALMGICFVTGFFIFGLTVEIFNLKMIDAFYSLTVAVLLAAATHKAQG